MLERVPHNDCLWNASYHHSLFERGNNVSFICFHKTQVCVITAHTKVLVSQPRSPQRLYNSLANYSSQVPKSHITFWPPLCSLGWSVCWLSLERLLKEMRWNLLKVASLKVIPKEASSWPGEFMSIVPTQHFYEKKRARSSSPFWWHLLFFTWPVPSCCLNTHSFFKSNCTGLDIRPSYLSSKQLMPSCYLLKKLLTSV